MEKNQRLIQEAKDKINSLEDEALDIPRDLVNANERLMIETVKVCYNKINSNKGNKNSKSCTIINNKIIFE